jgi:hypothetical protein
MKPQDVAQHVYLAIWHIAQGTGDMHCEDFYDAITAGIAQAINEISTERADLRASIRSLSHSGGCTIQAWISG